MPAFDDAFDGAVTIQDAPAEAKWLLYFVEDDDKGVVLGFWPSPHSNFGGGYVTLTPTPEGADPDKPATWLTDNSQSRVFFLVADSNAAEFLYASYAAAAAGVRLVGATPGEATVLPQMVVSDS